MKRFLWLFVGLTGGIQVLDQVTKALVSAGLILQQWRPIIPGFISLTLVHNTGAAFGILEHFDPKRGSVELGDLIQAEKDKGAEA